MQNIGSECEAVQMSMKNQYAFLGRPSTSYWLTPPEQQGYPELKGDLDADVAIVGGGIAGISTAYFLAQEGIKPVILEADRILFGTTGHTTAKITSQHELIYDKIKTKVSAEQAQQYAAANESAIAEIEKIVDGLNIDCDFEHQSAYVYTELDENIQKIKDEADAAADVGIRAEVVDKIPFGIEIKAALRFEGQAQFHPRKYLLALAEEITKQGCSIYEHSKVVDLEEGDGGYTLKTGNGSKIRAKKVVIASHYPFYNKAGLYFARIYVERSYIIAIRAKGEYPGGMYINAEEPTRSIRCQAAAEGDLILVGGENHKSGQSTDTLEHYKALIDFADRHFTVEDVPYHWSTQDCMTLDGIPYAGRFTTETPNLYIATGFGKWGMTNSTASAMLIRDLILRDRCDWEDVYSPSRFNMAASMKNVVVENANVAAELLEGKLSPLPDDVDIKPGEGRAVEIEGHRTGVYRDEDGNLYMVDTTCTHMGCELNWNTAEKSWDCPCHGSRFDVDGNVLEGPALRSLNVGKSVNTVAKLVKDEY
jgi:glycine/D-amino acid oxidase-like deaminating enzyme/nitrite reductase/ring-hydroxylating ferredoxin subunit